MAECARRNSRWIALVVFVAARLSIHVDLSGAADSKSDFELKLPSDTQPNTRTLNPLNNASVFSWLDLFAPNH